MAVNGATEATSGARGVAHGSLGCRDLIEVIANKWSLFAIGAMGEGPRRFGELLRELEGVSPRVLTQTLRRLEDHGLVTRTVYPVVPSHVEYALTSLGEGAAVPLAALREWAERRTFPAAGATEAASPVAE